MQFKVNRLRQIMCFSLSTQLAVYTVLELRGILAAYPRPSFTPATTEEKEAMRRALAEEDCCSSPRSTNADDTG